MALAGVADQWLGSDGSSIASVTLHGDFGGPWRQAFAVVASCCGVDLALQQRNFQQGQAAFKSKNKVLFA